MRPIKSLQNQCKYLHNNVKLCTETNRAVQNIENNQVKTTQKNNQYIFVNDKAYYMAYNPKTHITNTDLSYINKKRDNHKHLISSSWETRHTNKYNKDGWDARKNF
tara:strand:+ start:758 stop:1075 length:318 start_codon:yes stop_codon:yes gene_type:complete